MNAPARVDIFLTPPEQRSLPTIIQTLNPAISFSPIPTSSTQKIQIINNLSFLTVLIDWNDSLYTTPIEKSPPPSFSLSFPAPKMPSTDSLRTSDSINSKKYLNFHSPTNPEPPLTTAERQIVKSYGGWTGFMHSFGLKPWNQEDADEGLRIVSGLASND